MEAYRIEGSTCLVTGGAGALGSHIVGKLAERGAARIDVLDDFSEGSYENLEEVGKIWKAGVAYEGDLADLSWVRKRIVGQPMLPAPRYDFVLHTAGHLLLKTQADPYAALFANVIGTYNVLEACLAAGVQKLVFTSSISIFGEPEYTPVDEQHPLNNTTIYGATKVCGEQMCRDFGRRGLAYSILRPANIYGPRCSPKNGAFAQVVPKWIRCIQEGKPIVIFGDGKQTLDAVHITDMAAAHVLALTCRGADGEAYNIGSGRATRAAELAEILRREMGAPNHPIEYEAHDVCLVKQRRCAIEKAEQQLGYRPQYDLLAGIRDTIAWWKAREGYIGKGPRFSENVIHAGNRARRTKVTQ